MQTQLSLETIGQSGTPQLEMIPPAAESTIYLFPLAMVLVVYAGLVVVGWCGLRSARRNRDFWAGAGAGFALIVGVSGLIAETGRVLNGAKVVVS